MAGASRRSIRAQLLMAAVQQASNAAMRDDYLNAVTQMRAAAASTGYKMPPKPFGNPEIIRGDAWKKYRNYYHEHFERVHAHVADVLAKLHSGNVGVDSDEGDDE